MKKQVNSHSGHFVAIVGAMGILLVCMWILSLPQATVAQGPPPPLPPTLVPTATRAPAPPPTGGSIELHAQFPEAWPWSRVHWQELWTIVQWQDDKGVWRNVKGWQGTLDDIAIGEDGEVTGYKTWWAANADLGKGPFRWVVYKSQGSNTPIAISESFNLPAAAKKTVQVEVSLGL